MRGNLGERIPDFIVPGVTTREDVLMHLGEADGRSKDGSELNYVSRANRGGIGLLIFPVGATDYQRELQRTLIVEFDKAGLVKSTRLQVESCSVITGYWAHSPDQTTSSCVPVGEPVVLGDAPKAASPEPEP